MIGWSDGRAQAQASRPTGQPAGRAVVRECSLTSSTDFSAPELRGLLEHDRAVKAANAGTLRSSTPDAWLGVRSGAANLTT